jgi:hypothetical protein
MAAAAETLDFEKDQPGAPPRGFTIAKTGPGSAARWEVREDAGAPSGARVLVQASDDATSARFPLAVYDEAAFSDGTIALRFKAISGEVDQAAGIVWRYRDPENYYLVRANALEHNVVLYKVEKGKRTDLDAVGSGLFAYGKRAPVESGAWQELRVEVKGDLFRVSLDGAHLFDVQDETFAGIGKVGLWTKADSVTAFDDFAIAPAPPSP